MAKKLHILIADDHAIFRHGLKDILEKHFPGAKVGEARTGPGAMEQIREAAWDIVVLDITMPGRNGVDILRDVNNIRPTLPILILSMHPEAQYAARVLKAGAAGYIAKIKAPLEIVEAIKLVLAGGHYTSSTLKKRRRQQLKPGAKKLPDDCLSSREYQIACLIPSGKSLKEIAGELSVSIQTVSTYRARILKKLGLATTAGLIRYALEHKLVD